MTLLRDSKVLWFVTFRISFITFLSYDKNFTAHVLLFGILLQILTILYVCIKCFERKLQRLKFAEKKHTIKLQKVDVSTSMCARAILKHNVLSIDYDTYGLCRILLYSWNVLIAYMQFELLVLL